MQEFIGRTSELELLERIWSRERYKSCAVYGRRRIGKTRLINEFIKDKRGIVFDLIMGTENENAQRMSRILADTMNISTDSETLYDVFGCLKRLCSEEKMIIVLDELPYLTEKNKRAASEIQHFIDWMADSTESMIIVCGSSISLMLDKLKNREDPLYGRFHHEIDLGPLSLQETRGFHPSLSDQDLLRTYLTLGGIPLYHAGAGDRDYGSIVEEYLFDASGIFYNDATDIIISEMKELSGSAMSVLECIASGLNRFGDISSRTGLSDQATDRCLKGLMGMRLIDVLHPMAGAPKHPVYMITDPSAAFFFSIIRRNYTVSRLSEGIYDALKQQISGFLGRQFEIFCRAEIPKRYPCREIGSWWGAIPVREDDGRLLRDDRGKVVTEDEDIDLVATLHKGNFRIDLCAECKFTNRKASLTTLNNLERRVSFIKGDDNRILMIISVNGFEEDLEEYAVDNSVALVDMDVIIGKKPYPELF